MAARYLIKSKSARVAAACPHQFDKKKFLAVFGLTRSKMLRRRNLKFFGDPIALKYELVELTWLNTFFFQIRDYVTD